MSDNAGQGGASTAASAIERNQAARSARSQGQPAARDLSPTLLAILIAGLLVALYSLSQFAHDLWTPDEPRVAAVARETADGAWVAPTLNGVPFLEEPPLHAWLTAGAYTALGSERPELGRLISLLFGLGGVALTFLLARDVFAGEQSRSTAMFAALALGLCLEYFAVSHRLLTDGPLAFFTSLSALFYWKAMNSAPGARRIARQLVGAGAASLAFMTKGAVGVAVPLLFLVAVALVRRSLAPLKASGLWLLPPVFLLVCGPWLLLLFQDEGGAGFRALFVENTLWRIWPSSDYTGGHVRPFYYYLPRLVPLMGLSAVFSAGAVARRMVSPRELGERDREAVDLLLAWFGLGFLCLSLAGAKRGVYLTPFLPALAIVGGVWLRDYARGAAAGRLDRFLIWLAAACVAVAGCTPMALRLAFEAGWAPPGSPAALMAGLGATVWLMAAVGTISAALAVAFSARRAPRLALASLLLGILLLALAAKFLIVPAVDADKSLSAVSRRIGQIVPADAAIYAIRPDETTVAMLSLYAHRQTRALAEPSELGTLVRRGPVYLVVVDKRPDQANFEAARNYGGKAVVDWGQGRSRRIRLLRFGQ